MLNRLQTIYTYSVKEEGTGGEGLHRLVRVIIYRCLWIDPALGFAVRRRERYTGNPPRLFIRYEMSDHIQLRQDVWLPRRLRRIIVDTHHGEQAAETVADVLVDSTCVVSKLAINEDCPIDFEFVLEPGTIIRDDLNSKIFQLPGGFDYMERIIYNEKSKNQILYMQSL